MSELVTIDPEFKSLIPPLTDVERENLEQSLLREGCRDRLVVLKGAALLDGHTRHEICTKHNIEFEINEIDLLDRNAAKEWIIKNQFARRNLRSYQRIELALKLEPLLKERAKENQGARTDISPTLVKSKPADTQKELARIASVSHGTIHKGKTIAEEASDETKEQLRSGKTTVNRVYKLIKKQQKKEEKEEKAQATTSQGFENICDIRHCSFKDLFVDVTPDVVITDPPYSKEYLPLYKDLAILCHDVPLVAVMCGQSYLPEIFSTMTEHLKYLWTICYLTPGGQAVQQWPAKVNAFWKPILLFGETKEWFGDVVKSNVNDNDKRFHGWGQSESGIYDLVNRITQPGDLVCDPFLGGGTTAVVSLALGRKFVGCDTDKGCVDVAIQRSLEQCQMLEKKERGGET